MPLYEYRKNATNRVPVPPSVSETVVCGTQSVLDRILALVSEMKSAGSPAIAAIDGWYGVNWAALKGSLCDTARSRGISIEIVSTAGLYLSPAAIEAYRQPFVTDDPSFGYVNSKGVLDNLLDPQKIAALKTRLASRKAIAADALIVIGPGAAVEELAALFDLRFYADFTMQPLLWQMWEGNLVTFGSETPTADYLWKKYY